MEIVTAAVMRKYETSAHTAMPTAPETNRAASQTALPALIAAVVGHPRHPAY